jgi:hypothetical protein
MEAMLKPISADEVDLSGKALEVTYRHDAERDLLLVSVTAHAIEGEPTYVRRSEFVLVVIDEPMTRDAMHARIEIEAARRGIERVAWIEET